MSNHEYNSSSAHRGALNFADPAGTADTLDMTYGVTLGLGERSTLALGFVHSLH